MKDIKTSILRISIIAVAISLSISGLGSGPLFSANEVVPDKQNIPKQISVGSQSKAPAENVSLQATRDQSNLSFKAASDQAQASRKASPVIQNLGGDAVSVSKKVDDSANGIQTITGYDDSGRVVKYQEKRLYTSEPASSSADRPVNEPGYTEGPLVAETTYAYDQSGYIIDKTDKEYDGSGLVTNEAVYTYSDTPQVTTTEYTYDDSKNVVYGATSSSDIPVFDTDASSFREKTPDVVTTSGEAGDGKDVAGVGIPDDGYIKEYTNVLADGPYNLEFSGRNTANPAETPDIKVIVDGEEVGSIKVDTDRIYNMELELTKGPHAITLKHTRGDEDSAAQVEDGPALVVIENVKLTDPEDIKPAPVICTEDEVRGYIRERERGILRKAKEEIDANRKTDAMIKVTDSSGKALKDAEVTIVQVGQDFVFGSTYCFTDRFLDEADGVRKMVYYNIALVEKLAAVSDQATVAFFWNGLNPQVVRDSSGRITDVSVDTSNIDITLGLLAQKGVTDVTGKSLIWNDETAMPTAWLDGLDPDERGLAVKIYIQKMISRYSDPGNKVLTIDAKDPFIIEGGLLVPNWKEVPASINSWEVLSEPYSKGTLGIPVKDIFAWADEARGAVNPAAKLILNDYALSTDISKAYEYVKGLVSSGVKFDVLGIQAHDMGDSRIEDFKEVLDLYGSLGKDIYITEFELAANHEPISGSPWRGARWDEAAQSRYIRDFYSLVFSHPSVKGITYWNMADQPDRAEQWIPDSGILTGEALIKDPASYEMDIPAKPAYDALKALVRGDWTTRRPDPVKTNPSGYAAFKDIFSGKYMVTVKSGGLSRSGLYDIRKDQGSVLVDFSQMPD